MDSPLYLLSPFISDQTLSEVSHQLCTLTTNVHQLALAFNIQPNDIAKIRYTILKECIGLRGSADHTLKLFLYAYSQGYLPWLTPCCTSWLTQFVQLHAGQSWMQTTSQYHASIPWGVLCNTWLLKTDANPIHSHLANLHSIMLFRLT